jgi:prevent-host-death family protein
MQRELSLTKAREKLGDLVEQVQYQGDTILISRNGKPAVAIVSIEVYESWKRERVAFFDFIRQSQNSINLTGVQAESLASEAVEAVRVGD